eukprot:m.31163 g.31163  ORF g.31163 m.31163 type:complete len:149 (+) comp6904_c0_seq2:181-627(+)
MFSSANTLGITTAVLLYVSKPTEESFNEYFRHWVESNLVRREDDVVEGSLSEWISRGISWATVETVISTAQIQTVNGGVCHVVSATIPHPQREYEWVELIFVGVAGSWHFVPKEMLESGKVVAGYAGISLAVLSVVQTLYQGLRRIGR